MIIRAANPLALWIIMKHMRFIAPIEAEGFMAKGIYRKAKIRGTYYGE
jgi:hypothetical protein